MSDQEIHRSLEEIILKYLREHEDTFECSFVSYQRLDSSVRRKQETHMVVKEVLRDVLMKVDQTQVLKECYAEKEVDHNQYPLFVLKDVLPEFDGLSDAMCERLAFKESLLINDVDVLDEKNRPKCLGNLCMDVQIVKGMQPKAQNALLESDYSRIAFQTIFQARTEPNEELDDEDVLKEKLDAYEEQLRNEMKTEQNKFVVHLSSHLGVDGFDGGSRVTTWVDRKFHTLEEKRLEYLHEEQVLEKSIYFALQKGKYFVKTTSLPEETSERKYYGLAKTKDLIGEGANIILMRYLAIANFSGSFELSTMYINGDMCRNIYECKTGETFDIDGKHLAVCKIYRNIIEECGLEHHCCTVLTTGGKILQQEWEGCNVTININPIQLAAMGKPEKPLKNALDANWENDMQLLSKYLDCRGETDLKMRTYLKDHPEIQNLIADYVQNILLLKPNNIIPFTMDYFMSFEPYRTGRFPYFDGSMDDFNNDDFQFF